MIYNAKSVFLAVNASLCWLVSGVYLVQVSVLLIGQQGLGHFFRYRPLLPIGWRTVQIVRQRRRKITNAASTTLSAILSMHNYILHLWLARMSKIVFLSLFFFSIESTLTSCRRYSQAPSIYSTLPVPFLWINLAGIPFEPKNMRKIFSTINGWDLAEWLERLTVIANVATVLVQFQHPPTQWNLRGGRWSRV